MKQMNYDLQCSMPQFSIKVSLSFQILSRGAFSLLSFQHLFASRRSFALGQILNAIEAFPKRFEETRRNPTMHVRAYCIVCLCVAKIVSNRCQSWFTVISDVQSPIHNSNSGVWTCVRIKDSEILAVDHRKLCVMRDCITIFIVHCDVISSECDVSTWRKVLSMWIFSIFSSAMYSCLYWTWNNSKCNQIFQMNDQMNDLHMRNRCDDIYFDENITMLINFDQRWKTKMIDRHWLAEPSMLRDGHVPESFTFSVTKNCCWNKFPFHADRAKMNVERQPCQNSNIKTHAAKTSGARKMCPILLECIIRKWKCIHHDLRFAA